MIIKKRANGRTDGRTIPVGGKGQAIYDISISSRHSVVYGGYDYSRRDHFCQLKNGEHRPRDITEETIRDTIR